MLVDTLQEHSHYRLQQDEFELFFNKVVNSDHCDAKTKCEETCKQLAYVWIYVLIDNRDGYFDYTRLGGAADNLGLSCYSPLEVLQVDVRCTHYCMYVYVCLCVSALGAFL